MSFVKRFVNYDDKMETDAIESPRERIGVHVTWGFLIPVVTYLFIGLALYPQLGVVAEMFNFDLKGEPSSDDWVYAGLSFMVLGIANIIIHEMGHAIVLQRRYRKGAVISLTSQVGTKHPQMEMDDKLTALCGPALQCAYGLAVLCFGSLSNSLFFMVIAYYILADMAFNMLPFKGHDGHIVFRRAQPQSCH